MPTDRQTVVIGILYNRTRDRVLICRRSPPAHEGGRWEFPGGKLEQDETPLQALRRELREELAVTVESAHRLVGLDHDYPDRIVRLEVWVVDRWSGEPQAGKTPMPEWVPVSDLEKRAMPAANVKFLKLLNLPGLYLITPDQPQYDDNFLEQVTGYFRSGLRLLQFRSKLAGKREQQRIVRKLVQICESHAGTLIYNGTPEQAGRLGAHGVHLNSARLRELERRPLPRDLWVAASCHDAGELSHAARIGADFCVLAPVHKPASHPATGSLGWGFFKSLVDRAEIPVYALGGIAPEELDTARLCGAHGIAMISGVWNAPQPAAVISSLNR
jgi:8-oxo-dGTP diphosphatase